MSIFVFIVDDVEKAIKERPLKQHPCLGRHLQSTTILEASQPSSSRVTQADVLAATSDESRTTSLKPFVMQTCRQASGRAPHDSLLPGRLA